MKPSVFLLAAALAAATAAPLYAQCAANGKAIPFRSFNHHQIIVGVYINHSGPYDFLVDTGTQMTVIDQSLAAELHMPTTGSATVAGLSFQGNVAYAQLDSIALGDHASTAQGVLVYDMKNVQAAGFAIRGLLGDDFLSHFDVLIDHTHSVLCLSDTETARGGPVTPAP
jgi:hypothetical protein